MEEERTLEQLLSRESERTQRAAREHWHDGRYDAIVAAHRESLVAEAAGYAHSCASLRVEIAEISGRLAAWEERHKGERGLWRIVRNMLDPYAQPLDARKLTSATRMLEEIEEKEREIDGRIERFDSSSFEQEQLVRDVLLSDVHRSRSAAASGMWSLLRERKGLESFGRQRMYWTDGISTSVRDPELDWWLRPYDTVMLEDGYAIGITRYADYIGSRRQEDKRVIFDGYLFDLDEQRIIGTFSAGSNGGWMYRGITGVKVDPESISFEVIKGSYSRPYYDKKHFDLRAGRRRW